MMTALQRVAAVCGSPLVVPVAHKRLVMFARRDDPTLHRVVNATRASVEAPDVPHVTAARNVADKIQTSPLARAALLRLAKVGVGAAGGAYLGYKAHRRAGIRPGAKAGAIAGLLFEQIAENVEFARAIKLVPAAGPFPDGYLYHVTSTKNAPRIRREGLAVSGTRPTFTNQNAKGKAYLTEAKGVPFWKQRVEEHLTHNHDDPPGVAVFRVRPVGLKLKPDEHGTRDARARAYYSTDPIAPKHRVKTPRHFAMNTTSARVCLSTPDLAKLLKVSPQFAARLVGSGAIRSNALRREEPEGARVYFMADIAAARLVLEENRPTVELASIYSRDDETKPTLPGRALKAAAVGAGAAALVGGASYLRGRMALGNRTGLASPLVTALLGAKRLRHDGATVARKAAAFVRK